MKFEMHKCADGHLVLVKRLGSLSRNSTDRITDSAQHDNNVSTGP